MTGFIAELVGSGPIISGRHRDVAGGMRLGPLSGRRVLGIAGTVAECGVRAEGGRPIAEPRLRRASCDDLPRRRPAACWRLPSRW